MLLEELPVLVSRVLVNMRGAPLSLFEFILLQLKAG